jgi:hypothetical protein
MEPLNDNPWLLLPEGPPYVLPDDNQAVSDFNTEASEAHRLRVHELLPEPFVGDPDAPVVLLGNNPGYTPAGALRKQNPRFATRMRANLSHQPSDCPFVFFAEDIGEGHRVWWEKKLRGLLHFGHDALARCVLAVEHFPYPSARYGGGLRRLPLPSGAREYSYKLVRRAIQRRAVIALMRGERGWLRDVPALEGYDRLCTLKNPQAGSVSRKNCERFEMVERAVQAAVAGAGGA